MPVLSFQGEWLDRLLSGAKQQTTRQQTDRIKVDDVCNIYNQQRKQIIGKRLRSLTDVGYGKMAQLSHRGQLNYPAVPFTNPIRQYPAHFLGKVKIVQVRDIIPIEMTDGELKAWAIADGFTDSTNLGFTETELADIWFKAHQRDDGWMHRTWTVIKWQGWQERYFEPEE